MSVIGLIAGNGRFPFLVAEEIRKRGDSVALLALKEETDPAIESLADYCEWISVGQFQKLIDFFHSNKASTAIMAGQVKHARLFDGLSLDWRAIKLMGKLVNKKTDSILGAVCRELETEGITLLPSHQFLSHLLPEKGILAGPKLSKEEKDNIAFGHETAKAIAGLDIGQTVVVKDMSVIAVESIEGTDECIRRAAHYAKEGVIVAKVAKPRQDFRFDVPVIGMKTINTLKECKARAMAIEAGATLMIGKEEIVAAANKENITIIAL
jgi:DUF1009 family protein